MTPDNLLAADPELLGEFVVEAREHLAAIETEALSLEQNPDNTDALHTIFRAFHTIKGLAGFLDLEAIQSVAHEVETILDLARNAQLRITHAVIEGILASKDFLAAWIAAVDGGDRSAVPDSKALIAHVQSLALGDVSSDLPKLAQAVAEEPTNALVQTARKDVAVVKIQTGKLDYLVDMMGEMVITQSLIRHDPDLAAEGKPRLARNLSQLARITDELQRTAMSMRMVPVGSLFHKMSRLVRDLAKKSGKLVELVLEGEDTELDRNIVEELGDPLMHMIRNALDHGIEPPEARVQAGKNATARLVLKAGHQSGYVLISVGEDGRGLDRGKILKKAIDRGLTTAGAAETDSEIFNYIFHPGFSTADQVTDVSGRGVGMDVVKKQIQKLRGRVDIRSTQGQGTTFELKLPLTLAIIEALISAVGPERYVMPIYGVREILRPSAEMISTVQGRAEMALVRGALLPIVRLHQYFNVDPRATDPCDCILIIAESGEKRFCLMVDELIGKQEVVIKSLGEKFQHVQGVAGGAILGDGRIGLILDLERLFKEGQGD